MTGLHLVLAASLQATLLRLVKMLVFRQHITHQTGLLLMNSGHYETNLVHRSLPHMMTGTRRPRRQEIARSPSSLSHILPTVLLKTCIVHL
jgi:hypothetical protein